MRRSTLTACALLCAFTALAGCASVTGPPPHPSPTVTSATSPTLTWHEVAMPSGASLKTNTYLSFAPSPAHVIWACVALSRQQFAIWALRAPGGTWQHTGMISPSVPPLDGRCVPVADQTDPHSLAVVFATVADGDVATGTTSSISTDDGAHWQQVGDKVKITEMAEIGGKTIALLDHPSGLSGPHGLVISGDHLRTWANVTMPPAEASDITRLWISPAGDFLAMNRNAFWRSKSQGASWERASDSSVAVDYVVWLSSAHTWRLCNKTGPTNDDIECTDDFGKSWDNPPRLSQTNRCHPIYMAGNGSIFAYCSKLMMLPLNGSQWLDLGPGPDSIVASWDDGILWSLDGQGKLFTASLPA
jgi:hypothetical protein